MNVEESGDLYTNDTIKKTGDRDMVGVRVPKLVGQADGCIAQEK